MHIVSLQAENIKRLVAVEIKPDGNVVGRFAAKIKVNYQYVCLGTFDTARDAGSAYAAAASEMFGEYARI